MFRQAPCVDRSHSKTGETLIGVNVFIDGTSTGTATDLDGYYSIEGLDAEHLYPCIFLYLYIYLVLLQTLNWEQ